MDRVGNINCPNVSRLTCFWVTCAVYSDHWLWPFLFLLGISCQDLLNVTDSIIIRVLMSFFFLFSLSLSLISFYWILCSTSLQFEKVAYNTCDLWIANIICNSIKCVISLNIFCIVLFYYYAKIPKNSPKLSYKFVRLDHFK